MPMFADGSALRRTWNDFVEALHAPVDQEFQALYWIYRLSYALLDTFIPCRDDKRRKHISGFASRLRPLVPSAGIILILLCVGSYFTTFRDTAVIKKGKSDTLHTSFVIWVATNILSHYLYCIFKSPGVVIPPKSVTSATTNNVNASEANRNDAVTKIGGCCFIRSRVKIKEEKKRNIVYKLHINNDVKIHDSSEGTFYHPIPNDTFCLKCEIDRPPRSHHCRVCRICVLEYDHHCPWVNGCIGYNNYRNFVLLVFYLMLGCLYGVCMLAADFVVMIKEHIALHGFKLMGSKYSTGLLDLPPPWTILRDYQAKGRIDDDVILRAVFPFLLLVCICMSIFLLDHIQSIARGYTTLEKKTRPDRNDVVNPFDLGIKNNFQRVFGKSLIHIVFPLKPQTW